MSKASRRRDALAREGLGNAYRWEGPVPPLHPIAMVQHPERARAPMRVPLRKTTLTYHQTYVPDDTHPLGGYLGTLVLHRRVNLTKDEMPTWIRDRPLYEFTKESPS